jgi:hypothetical protein
MGTLINVILVGFGITYVAAILRSFFSVIFGNSLIRQVLLVLLGCIVGIFTEHSVLNIITFTFSTAFVAEVADVCVNAISSKPQVLPRRNR